MGIYVRGPARTLPYVPEDAWGRGASPSPPGHWVTAAGPTATFHAGAPPAPPGPESTPARGGVPAPLRRLQTSRTSPPIQSMVAAGGSERPDRGLPVSAGKTDGGPGPPTAWTAKTYSGHLHAAGSWDSLSGRLLRPSATDSVGSLDPNRPGPAGPPPPFANSGAVREVTSNRPLDASRPVVSIPPRRRGRALLPRHIGGSAGA